MKKIYEKEYSLRAGDFDKFNRLKPSSILDIFQDIAGLHSEELNVGFKAMLEKNYLWVLVHVKFKILSTVSRYETVKVKTWPLAPNRLSYRREYSIENMSGEKLIVGSSDWVVVHNEKRKFLSVPDLYPFSDGFHNEMMLEEKIARIKDFETDSSPYPISVGFCDLDINNHVNNTKYANYVLDALNPTQNDIIESFQIDYRKEVTCGTPLNIYLSRENKKILSKGTNIDGENMFVCEITLN